jgi:hypothetical protein
MKQIGRQLPQAASENVRKSVEYRSCGRFAPQEIEHAGMLIALAWAENAERHAGYLKSADFG